MRWLAAFSKKKGTEIGWGSQTTLVALQALPFVYAYGAQYLLYGSEYLNNRLWWAFEAGRAAERGDLRSTGQHSILACEQGREPK